MTTVIIFFVLSTLAGAALLGGIVCAAICVGVRKTDTETRILTLLRETGERASLDIRVDLELGHDAYWLLRSMEGRRLLVSRESEPVPERGGRPRRLYSLPGGGR